MTLKLSRTAIRELTAQYRAVLRNAALVAAGIVLTTGTANAEATAVTGLSNFVAETGYGTVTTGSFATAGDFNTLDAKIATNAAGINTNKDDIAEIKNGTAVVGKATADADGNVIANTYAKKTDVDTAISGAKTYADGLAVNYDAAGAADTAEQNAKDYAKSYADGLAVNYDAAGAADTAEQNAKDYAKDYADAAVDAEELRAEGIEAGLRTDINNVTAKVGTVVDGNFVKAAKTVGENLGILDTQVKQNKTDIAKNVEDIAKNTNAINDIKDGYAFTGDISTVAGKSIESGKDVIAAGAVKGATLDVTGNASMAGASVSGTTTTKDLSVTDSATIGGTLKVDGKSTLDELSAGATTLVSMAIGDTNMGFDASGNVTAGTLNAGVSKLASLAIGATDKGFDASGNLKANAATVNSLKIGSTANGFDGDGNLKAKGITADGNYSSESGNIALTNGNLNLAHGNATVGGKLSVSDVANLSGGINVNSKFTVDTAGKANVASLDAGSGEIKTTGAVKAGTLETTGNASVGGELVAGGDLKVKNSENTVFKVESATGNTTVGGTLKVGAANAISGTETGVLNMGTNSLNNIANMAMTGNATIGGTLNVAGKSTLGELSAGATTLTSLAFGDGHVVSAIDNGTVPQTLASENADKTLATVATVLTSAENATYTSSNRLGANVTSNTLRNAIDQLDQTIGDRRILSANTAINTALMGEYDEEIAEYTGGSVAKAIEQIGNEIGEFAKDYVSNGNIVKDNTVNDNLALLDTNIGNLSQLATANGNFGDAPASVVDALNGVDATLGKVHGLVTSDDGVKQFNGSAASTNIEGDEYKGNLAVGTTVEDHLVSLDNAIGVRDIHSVNTALNTVAREQSLSKAMELTGNLIGDMDLQGKYIGGTTNLTDAVNKLDSNLARIEDHVEHVKDNAERGIAAISALTALVPNARDCGSTQLSFGTGNYNDKFGFALGGFHYFNDHVLMNAGASWGGDKNVAFRAGVTVGLGF